MNADEQIIDAQTKLDASSLLASMRLGNDNKLRLRYRKEYIPCRLLTSNEEAECISKAQKKAKEKTPEDSDQNVREIYRSGYTMKSILKRCTSIHGDVGFTDSELEDMSSEELTYLYDQYVTVCKIVDVDFEAISDEELKNIITNVKKKVTNEKSYFSWQLAAIGKFFLKEVVPNLPEVKEAGS